MDGLPSTSNFQLFTGKFIPHYGEFKQIIVQSETTFQSWLRDGMRILLSDASFIIFPGWRADCLT